MPAQSIIHEGLEDSLELPSDSTVGGIEYMPMVSMSLPAVYGTTHEPSRERIEVDRAAENKLPQTWDQAVQQTQQCANFLAAERSSSPVAYLLLHALGLEAMRVEDVANSAPPSTDSRMLLKHLNREESWEELHNACLKALVLPSGSYWLDLHRHLWSASMQLEHHHLADAIVRSCRSVVDGHPSTLRNLFADDTPVASEETLEWIKREVLATAPAANVALEPPRLDIVPTGRKPVQGLAEDPPPDVLAEAERIAANGNLHGATELLFSDTVAKPSGRHSFQRRLQIARLCLTYDEKQIASRMLRQLASEIDDRQLGSWEEPCFLTEVISLLLRSGISSEQADREALFSRLCQLDPTAALSFGTQVKIGVGEAW